MGLRAKQQGFTAPEERQARPKFYEYTVNLTLLKMKTPTSRSRLNHTLLASSAVASSPTSRATENTSNLSQKGLQTTSNCRLGRRLTVIYIRGVRHQIRRP
jgi:hypothetical protein